MKTDEMSREELIEHYEWRLARELECHKRRLAAAQRSYEVDRGRMERRYAEGEEAMRANCEEYGNLYGLTQDQINALATGVTRGVRNSRINRTPMITLKQDLIQYLEAALPKTQGTGLLGCQKLSAVKALTRAVEILMRLEAEAPKPFGDEGPKPPKADPPHNPGPPGNQGADANAIVVTMNGDAKEATKANEAAYRAKLEAILRRDAGIDGGDQ